MVKEEATFRTTLAGALVTGSDQLQLTMKEKERANKSADQDQRINLWDEILPAFDPRDVRPVRA